MTKRKTNRAAFGSVRRLPSGRWQARYPDAKGNQMTAPTTFPTKTEALDHIAAVRADRFRGVYRDHRDGLAVTFDRFAADWIANGGSRGKLAPRTAELYRDILARQLQHFDGMAIAAITPAEVRSWYSRTRKTLADDARKRAEATAKRRGLDAASVVVTRDGSTRLRQAYALLKAVMTTAVADGLAPVNPCQIVGAGIADAPERPMLETDTLAAIVATMPAHYRLPILTAFAAHMRLGEVIGLERADFIAERGALRVAGQDHGSGRVQGLKQGAGRVTPLPAAVAQQLGAYLASSRGFPRDALFTRPLTPTERAVWTKRDGRAPSPSASVPITRSALQQAWAAAVKRAGFEGVHFHDIKHSSLTTAAQAGASLRELMDRAGHKTARAALIYQHASEQRQTVLAEALGELSGGLFGAGSGAPYGTRMARTAPAELEPGAAAEGGNPF